VRVRCQDVDAAVYLVLMLGDDGAIVEPAELRETLVSSARSILTRYGDTA